MKLNKLYHNDKYWVEYGVYSLALKEKERALNEIYKDLQKAAQAEIAELKELIKREVVPDIKDAEIARLKEAYLAEKRETAAFKERWNKDGVIIDELKCEKQKLQSAIDVAVEGLEYYANKDNWKEEDFDCSTVCGVIKEEDVYYIREQSKPPYYDYAAGGIKANSTLDKIKQIRGEK